ncbi:FRIGIDA-like protein 3 [Rosa sericea]
MLNKCCEDMELEEKSKKECGLDQNSIEQCGKEIGLKGGELEWNQKSMAECFDRLESREGKMREMYGAFGLLKKSMEEWCCKVELKERGIEECVAKLELKEKQVESRFEELNVIDKRVNECLGNAQLKEKQLDSVMKLIQEDKQHLDWLQKSVEEREKQMSSVSNGLQRKERELELQQQQIDSVYHVFQMKENELEQQAQELDLKRQQYESLCHLFQIKEGQLEKQSKDLELKHKQIESIRHLFRMKESQLENRAKELGFKQQQNDSISQLLKIKERELEQREKELEPKQQQIVSVSQTLQMKERKLEQQAKELDLKQKQFDSQVKMVQLIHAPAANNATIPSSATDESRSSINMDGRGLQFFMYEQLKRIDSMRAQMSAAFQVSSDPGNLVLDAMQGFYPSNSNMGNRETDFDLSFIRRSCILLLQELKRMSPQLNPGVREKALKLAAHWKAKLTVATDNSLEVLGFLRLVTAFELTSAYDANELQSLLSVVTQPEQAAQLRKALGVKDKEPSTNSISPLVKVVEPASTNAATFPSSNIQPNVTKDAGNVSGFGNKPLSGNHSILAASVPLSSDPAKLVLDSIQKSLAEYLRNGDCEESIMSSNISLLEELMRVSPNVGPNLKAEATNLSVQWKAKMAGNTEKSLEGVGFLLFLATYGLLSTLNTDEIVKHLGLICHHKQALELCQARGFADKIGEFIRILVEKKQLIEAVRFIFAFKLTDKLSPVKLLKEYLEDTKKCSEAICMLQISQDEKEKVADGLLGDLRAVHQYIKDYNLESKYPSADIEMQIVKLETVKSSPASNVEQQEQRKRKKPSAGTSTLEIQPPQQA